MSLLQEANLTDDIRIRRIAERVIAREMKSVISQLELLRDDLHRSNELQRIELQEFYQDAMAILAKGKLLD
jgi:hypothetical protein